MPKLIPFFLVVSEHPPDVAVILEKEGIKILSNFVFGFFVLGSRKHLQSLYKYNWVLAISIPKFLKKRNILRLFRKS